MATRIVPDPGSFRDRSARIFHAGEAVYRGLTAEALADWKQLSRTRFFESFTAQGRIVKTEVPPLEDLPSEPELRGWEAVLRHQRIPFISYPYEWSFGMLREAALLQLDLLAAALDEQMTLKDASPFNVQWIGAQPVFIDIASFTRLRAGEPWIGYRQFCQLYLNPLLLFAYKGVSFHAWLRGSLEGIDLNDFRRLMSLRDLLRPGVLTHVVMHSRLQDRYAGTEKNVRRVLHDAGFTTSIMRTNVNRMRRLVSALPSPGRQSAWTSYATNNTYDEQDEAGKVAFVGAVVQTVRSRRVWDLGCNTGRFSSLAAAHADYVVAVDADHAVIDALYRRLAMEGIRNVLPLVANVASPSPALGWRGVERQPLEARGRPDLVLCLALVHHLSITANLPLVEIVDWLAGLGARLVIEFVTREDPMVMRLLQQSTAIHNDYDPAIFEAALTRRYIIERRTALPSGTRILFAARPQ